MRMRSSICGPYFRHVTTCIPVRAYNGVMMKLVTLCSCSIFGCPKEILQGSTMTPRPATLLPKGHCNVSRMFLLDYLHSNSQALNVYYTPV